MAGVRQTTAKPSASVRSKKPALQCLGCRFRPAGDAEFLIDVVQVALGAVLGEAEGFRDLLVGQALGDQIEDFQLAG